MVARRAGQHARATTRRLAARALAATVVLGVVGIAARALGGPTGVVAAVELAVVAGLIALERIALPGIERWDRGASGEEHVGAVLDALADQGWLAVHDVRLERGNIDHVVIGPGGVVAIETKSHAGRVAVDRVDERMLKQAYAEAKAVERALGRPVTPLLVFSRAYLDRPVSRRRGVTVLPARMLADHLARRATELSPTQITDIHQRLCAAAQ